MKNASVFKIDFQRFGEKASDDEALMAMFGLDKDGNRLDDGNSEDNPETDPSLINPEEAANPPVTAGADNSEASLEELQDVSGNDLDAETDNSLNLNQQSESTENTGAPLILENSRIGQSWNVLIWNSRILWGNSQT